MIKHCNVWFKDISDPVIFVAVDIQHELLMPYLIGVQKIMLLFVKQSYPMSLEDLK